MVVFCLFFYEKRQKNCLSCSTNPEIFVSLFNKICKMNFITPTPHDEIILLLSSGASPEEIVRYKPSEGLQERVSSLLRWSKERQLDYEEQCELDHYLVLEHIMRLAKIHARRRIAA